MYFFCYKKKLKNVFLAPDHRWCPVAGGLIKEEEEVKNNKTLKYKSSNIYFVKSISPVKFKLLRLECSHYTVHCLHHQESDFRKMRLLLDFVVPYGCFFTGDWEVAWIWAVSKVLKAEAKHQFRMKKSKGGWSPHKFRQSQIGKFEDLNNLLDLRTFRKCATLRILYLRTQPFCDLGT
jgi:hypothetical protein